jgi:hypothetical protein
MKFLTAFSLLRGRNRRALRRRFHFNINFFKNCVQSGSVCDSCSDDKEPCSSSRLLSQSQVSLYTTIAGSIRTNEKDRENQKSRIKVGHIQARTPHSVWWWICELRSTASWGAGGGGAGKTRTVTRLQCHLSEYTGSCSDSNECTARKDLGKLRDFVSFVMTCGSRPGFGLTSTALQQCVNVTLHTASRVNSGARAPDTNRQSNLFSPSNCARVLKQWTLNERKHFHIQSATIFERALLFGRFPGFARLSFC